MLFCAERYLNNILLNAVCQYLYSSILKILLAFFVYNSVFVVTSHHMKLSIPAAFPPKKLYCSLSIHLDYICTCKQFYDILQYISFLFQKDPACYSFTAEPELSGLTKCEMGSLAHSGVQESGHTDTVQIFNRGKIP